jgi:dipeptidyl aminopeptidase/acylaminoacyl peptidase
MSWKLLAILAWLRLVAIVPPSVAEEKRPITVEDAIAMTRLADPMYFVGGMYEVAQFSPDGSKFVIVLRKGDLATNTNIYTIYLFHTASALKSPKPQIIAHIASGTNLPAIRDVQWLPDNRRIAFLGVTGSGRAQVYLLDAQSQHLEQMTHHKTDVQLFSISGNGRTILFAASPRPIVAPEHSSPRVITERSLADVLFGNREQGDQHGLDLFLAGKREKRVLLPDSNRLGLLNRLFVSPDGKSAIVTADYRVIPQEWQAYQDERIRTLAQRRLPPNASTGIQQMFLVDVAHGIARPIVSAPAPYPAQVFWSSDSQGATYRTFFPLTTGNASETGPVPVELSIPDKKLGRITPYEWEHQISRDAKPPLRITLEEDPNTPPKIFAAQPSGDQRRLLMDLNPQFSQLAFGKVENLILDVRGIHILAGVYYPPDYVPGRRYPLVIQTHGFDRKRFSMDGSDEWSSGFAARPLAAKGFIVLQMLEYLTDADHEMARMDPSLGSNKLQRAKELVKVSIEAAIDELDRNGLIDEKSVGISGFSRTVMFVAYTLTHSDHSFRAGVLTDGIDAGWYQYLTYGDDESPEDNGGQTPFSKNGMAQWMKESPSFSMDRVQTPMRIVALGDPNLLEMWEWYSALRLQNKPVEFVEIPDAPHLLERPKDRLEAMQGLVEWFQFWLQGLKDGNRLSMIHMYCRTVF